MPGQQNVDPNIGPDEAQPGPEPPLTAAQQLQLNSARATLEAHHTDIHTLRQELAAKHTASDAVLSLWLRTL